MCLQPKYILHPTLKRIFNSSNFTRAKLGDKDVYVGSLTPFFRAPHDLPADTKYVERNYYLYDPETGDSHPLYFGCPCGKCADCLTSKYGELSARLQFEVLSYPPECRVIFFTLTYSDDFLPADGVSREHVTDFINRMHLYSKRLGLPQGFRTFVVSEYGSDPRFTHRPHYHGLVFGLDLSTYGHVKLFNKLIRKSWRGRGRLDWQFARSSHGVSKYCTKYVIKGLNKDFVPSGKNPNFISYPIKSGGLGVNALKNPVILDKILKSEDGTITVSTLEYGEQGVSSGISRIRIPRFIIDKLFPPFSRFITSNVKRCLQWCSEIWNRCMSHLSPDGLKSPCEFEKKFGYLRNFVGNKSPFLIDLPLEDVLHEQDCLQNSPLPVEDFSYLDKLKKIYNSITTYLDNYKYSCDYALERLRVRGQYLVRFAKFRNDTPSIDLLAYKSSFISTCYRDSPLDAVFQL